MLAQAGAASCRVPSRAQAVVVRRAPRRGYTRACVVRPRKLRLSSATLVPEACVPPQRPRADALGMQPWQSNEVAGLLFGVRRPCVAAATRALRRAAVLPAGVLPRCIQGGCAHCQRTGQARAGAPRAPAGVLTACPRSTLSGGGAQKRWKEEKARRGDGSVFVLDDAGDADDAEE